MVCMEDMQKYSMNTNIFTPREADLFIISMCLYFYTSVHLCVTIAWMSSIVHIFKT